MALMELSPILILSAAGDGDDKKRRSPKQTSRNCMSLTALAKYKSNRIFAPFCLAESHETPTRLTNCLRISANLCCRRSVLGSPLSINSTIFIDTHGFTAVGIYAGDKSPDILSLFHGPSVGFLPFTEFLQYLFQITLVYILVRTWQCPFQPVDLSVNFNNR